MSVMSLPPAPVSRPLPLSNATLAARHDVSATLATFIVALDSPLLNYKPGQYVSLGVPVDGQLLQRPYSVVSLGLGGTRVELFVRRLPDGRLSNELWRMSLGDRLVVGRAKGLFTIDWSDPRPRVMVGTGTGVAPLVAMLSAAAVADDATPNVLIHGASHAFELAHLSRIEALIDAWFGLDYRPTISRPRDDANIGWKGLTGRADAQLAALLEERPDLSGGGSVAYLCGNPDMVAACSGLLLAAGFSSADIHQELFHLPQAAARAA